MKISEISLPDGKARTARRAAQGGLFAALTIFICLGWNAVTCQAQQPDNDAQGQQVLTRGPVHEAFAGIVSYDPEPGIVVSKTPPEVIEEEPPEERPEGDNVAWIPGYWAWDDERDDFLWISGTWRALPPGREWVAGYWTQNPQGYQWISGYWADSTATETTYLPPPPATVEEGPNIEAPSSDYGWTPGCWLWVRGRYAWRPGYWAQGRADWDWVPAHYVWTPRGFIFVEGYWDYSVERRGILFAPVYFERNVYSRRGYHYSPTIVISLGVFSDHLFLRPRYCHYYFGDYYAPNYQQSGIYASFSFHSSRRGYDPFYSHQRWAHRDDREWEHRAAASYEYRRDHEAARPPRTWTAQIRIDSRSAASTENRMQVAVSFNQMAKRKDGPARFQPVARAERQQIVQRGQEVQKSREQRRSLEARAENQPVRTQGAAPEPVKVQMPRSPIVAKPANRMSGNEAPPKVQRAPRADPKLQPKVENPRRQPDADRRTPQTQTRQPEAEKKSAPGRNPPAASAPPVQAAPEQRAKDSDIKAQEKSRQNTKQPGQKPQQESERRAKTEATKNAEESQRHGRESESQQESDQRAKASALKAQEQSQRDAREQEQKAQQESGRRAKAEATRNAEESQRQARELQKRSQQETEQHAKAETQKTLEQSQRNTKAQEQRAQQESERRTKAAAAAKAAEDSQRNARAVEMKAQQEAEQRAKLSTIRTQEESQRNAQATEQKARRESVKPDRKAPGADKKNVRPEPARDQREEEKKKKQSPEDSSTP